MIKFLVMDVDGTLTDGKIYMGSQGELMKSFDIKDGCGIKDILPEYGITPVIITARTSQSLEKRCKELGITSLYQGIRNKLEKLDYVLKEKSLRDNCEYKYSDVAYIGDDILDLQCMEPIKLAGGIIGCPLNAVSEVVKVSDFVSVNRGGDGAVREFIEWLVREDKNKMQIGKKVDRAIDFINNLRLDELELGTYQNGEDYFMVQKYKTKLTDKNIYEAHKKYIDIQYIIEGKEKIKITDIKNMSINVPYNATKDVILGENLGESIECVLFDRSYVVLYPEHAHNPCIAVDNESTVKKLVYKVKIENC